MAGSSYPPLSPVQTGMAAKCPRCGQGALFEGFLTLRPVCSVCDLDYAQADTGDGPAVFIIFITGFVGVTFAFVLRFILDLPVGLVFLAAVLLTIVLTFALLRPMKGVLVALQFKNKATEGRLE